MREAVVIAAELQGVKMMRPDEADEHSGSDLRVTAASSPAASCRGAEAQQAEVLRQQALRGTGVPTVAPSLSGANRTGRKEMHDSRSPGGRRGRGPSAAVLPTRAVKRGVRGHNPTRPGRAYGGRRKASHVASSRGSAHEAGPTGDTHPASKEVPSEGQPPLAEDVPPMQPLEPRRSTYFSICLNASPDELTVVSYNLRMEGSCCSFDDNWRRREAALSRYLLSLEDAHHPDVILLQGAYATSTLQLIRRLVREEPMYPFQTRVVGGDPGCCKVCTEDGGCSCGSGCWFCLPFPQRKAAKKAKGPAAAFVTNNGWDSVSGAFSRFRGNGGILVISKWPILRRHSYVFTKSAYPQSVSNVGAALVQVEKCGKVYNVLAMQLQPGVNHNALRVAQVKEVMAWARTGMEDAEKVEFASFDIDGALTPTGEASTRSCPSEAANSVADGPQNGGLPELENRQGTAANQVQEQPDRTRCAVLPKGILKATDPLIIGGNLNFRFSEDHAFLAEALGPDGFRATLALEDASLAQPSFDSVNNDTCFQSKTVL
ncbi:hypothetical protein Efla_002900 [Eimeria flavescens]